MANNAPQGRALKTYTKKESAMYYVGLAGQNVFYNIIGTALTYYLQFTILIPAFTVSVIMAIARVWDAVNDPMMGMIVDKTNTKMGKYRPWILTGALLNAIVLCLLFNNPGFALNSVVLYIYVAVLYVFWGMTNTLADIPFWSMIPSFASEEKDRNLVSTIARTFSGLGQGIIVIFTAYAVAFFGGATGSKLDKMDSACLTAGFGKWSMVTAAALVFFALICVLSTKERRVVVNNDKFSFKQAISVIKQNDQLLVFMLFAMISNAGFYMTSGISS